MLVVPQPIFLISTEPLITVQVLPPIQESRLPGADPNFITDGSDVKFSDGTITLATASDLTVHTGEGGEGDITVAGKILGTDDGTATTVTLDAGTGDITLSEEIGGTGNDDIELSA